MTNATADKTTGTKGRKITVTLPDGNVVTYGRVTSTHVTIVLWGDDHFHAPSRGCWGVYMDHRSEAAALKTAQAIHAPTMVLEVMDPTV